MLQDARAQTIGFIGVGTKSAVWAKRLADRGFALVVWDRVRDLPPRLLGEDVVTVPHIADLSQRAGIIVCAVETGTEVEAVLGGPDGAIEAASLNDVIVCLSTIDPTVLRRMGAIAAPRGVELLDSPLTTELSGGDQILKAYVGGSAEALERVRPLLSVVADEIVYFGRLGNGLAMKHVVNMLAQVHRVLIVEALALGSKAGLDLRTMVDTISGSKGDSVAFQRLTSRILAQNFSGVPMRTTRGDIAVQVEMANSLDMPVLLTSAALQVYKLGVSMGLGDLDSSALTKIFERCTGIVLQAEQP
jgi:3-hydroxyisobutyrate dehydrogenase-like beta-hydroxyacid dehydrogenase